MKVLIVDDSVTMRKIAKNQFSALGITDIVEGNDGEEGLKVLEANMPVDIITLDINMPKMDGLTTLKNIRANPAYKDIKIIMVTSESEKKTVVEALKAGANDYLVKPFTPDSFKEKLKL